MSGGRMRLTLILAVGALLSIGCRRGVVAIHPLEPVLVIESDTLTFQATGFANVTDVRDYHWRHPGGTALIWHGSALTAGAGTLTVLDAAGSRVYSAPLAGRDTVETGTGNPGAWIVRVSLAEASGTVRFSVWPGSYRPSP